MYGVCAAAAYLVPGLVLLLLRRQWHVVGWLLCLFGLCMAIGMSSAVGVTALRMGDAWTAWLFDVFEGSLFWLPMTALLMVFPDGLAAQTARQRRLATVVLGAAGLVATLELFATRVSLGEVSERCRAHRRRVRTGTSRRGGSRSTGTGADHRGARDHATGAPVGMARACDRWSPPVATVRVMSR